MNFKIGDIVSRKSYNNDCVFVIYKIKDGIAFLKGKCKRLNADAPLSDLKINENVLLCKGVCNMSENFNSHIACEGTDNDINWVCKVCKDLQNYAGMYLYQREREKNHSRIDPGDCNYDYI